MSNKPLTDLLSRRKVESRPRYFLRCRRIPKYMFLYMVTQNVTYWYEVEHLFLTTGFIVDNPKTMI